MFPLMMQNLDMVKVFLDAKADLNVRDENGATTLMWSVYNDDADVRILQELLKAAPTPTLAIPRATPRWCGQCAATIGRR